MIVVPNHFGIISQAPSSAIWYEMLFGFLWGIGGIMFGKSIPFIGELCHEVGFPAGVVTVLCGDVKNVGIPLCESTIPKLITIIGSTESAQALNRQSCATSLKRFSMECGGLASYVSTRDQKKMDYFAHHLEFGEVQLNGVKYDIYLPHGGIKNSGLSVDCSELALDDYMIRKRVIQALAI